MGIFVLKYTDTVAVEKIRHFDNIKHVTLTAEDTNCSAQF